MNNDIILDTKLVGSIKGNFYVPSYQRGYRWGKEEVTRLLDDIYSNGNKNYCLQPIVLKNDGERYELIDGQQRLTTLYILLKYIQKEYKPKIKIGFSLTYQIRTSSAEFLDDICEDLAYTNIDFYHIYHAYKTIDEWFVSHEDDVVVADDIYGFLVKYVKIIWYEVDSSQDSISLFTRLNIGKIPLTSAELVKAMFLSRDNEEDIDRKKQDEISLQWDNIERALHNDSLWYFLTNNIKNSYQTRIDLVLDLISGKQETNREKYYTFFRFDEMRHQNEKLDNIWRRIQKTFLILKDWYEDHELYHKIGYLIALNSSKYTLQSIFDLSRDKTKNKFKEKLNELIKESVSISGNYADLSYDKPLEYKRISTLLLLFNVESVRQNGEHTQWFPFDKFKYSKGDKNTWSLEHIHAQQSEGMRTQEVWKKWLEYHIPSVKIVDKTQIELVEEMQDAIDKASLERTEFETIKKKVLDLLSVSGNNEYLHSIANLALLNTADNAALNNSTFDVKRNKIIEMDRNGQYIPFCTKMVFLKYYTPSENNDLHFWGQPDRIAYVNEINKVLEGYLEPIILEKEEA